MNSLILLKTLALKNTPVYVHYGITHRCNLRCRMCGVWKTGCAESELNIDQIKQMASLLHKLGTQVISIGGGEPLIRKDLPQAADAFMREGISVRILSNGVIDNRERLDELINAGVYNYSISLDTLDAKVQNHIIGRNDAFDQIMKTISYLSPIINRSGGIGLINTVVSASNIDYLTALVEFAKDSGFYISFVPLEIHTFSGQVLSCTETMQDMQFSSELNEKVKSVFSELIKLKSRGAPIFNSSVFLENAGRYLSEENCKWSCQAGRLYFSVSPEGFFSMCHRYFGYSSQGNELSILDPDFEAIFRSKEYVEQVKTLSKNCKCCLRPCWAEISNIFLDPKALLEMISIQGKKVIKSFATEKKS